MRYKFDAFRRFKEYRVEVENQTGRKIKSLRSDRGGEYLSGESIDYLKENGILSQWTPPKTSQLNDVVKRRNQTQLVMVRSMINFIELPLSFYSYALETATELLNMVPSKTVSQMPYEIWHGTCVLKDANGSTNISLKLTGEVTAFKARLVAKGYTQRPGVDFEETYSPVAMAKSIQILLAIAAWYDYEIWKMDVKINFLSGFVEEEIYMDQPEGFTFVGEEQKKKISGSTAAYPVLYVDDILLIGNDVKVLGDIKAWLFTQFSMKDMDEASYILGIKICYIDTSFQSDDDDAKSQLRFVFMLNSGVVAWKSSKQVTIADSTTEVEYTAASEAAKEEVWMKNNIQELGVVPNIAEPVVICCNNNGAIVQAKEPRSHHCSKNIHRCYHLLREMVSRGDVRTDRVSSADPLTKPISQIAHTQYLYKMGLRSMGD
ncbi:UNVERIFIED_CONTAM: Retrovirus-related Pol polyprotein from transposon RE1 [Sesamum latifolium]|uniref:Retrovirus-related Pol polyprotein from transposon RE1 n=1 Tax=Sesamum latifolium TaxID=2727402 RepID=A0AAW2XRB7_9LAMI